MTRGSSKIGRIIVACALLGAHIACSGGGDDPPPPPPPLAITPAAQTVDAGGSTATFTVSNNGTDTVTWELTGPGSIAPSTGQTTTYTPPLTVTGTTNATLTARAGGRSATATITVNVPPCTLAIAGPVSVDAGAAAVTYTANASASCSGTVAWSLSGPGAISPASGPSTQYTPPASLASATSATLTASVGSTTRTFTISIRTQPPITVTGTVLDPNGQPVANIPVLIRGRPATATDANGRFTVTGVSRPYDCTAVWTSLGGIVVVYTGLTRSDPTIHFIDFGAAQPKSATISGTLSPINASADDPVVAFGSPHTSEWTFAIPGTFDYQYSLAPEWYGPASTMGTLHALQWTSDANGLPGEYVGYGSQRDVTISNGGTFTRPNIALTPAPRASIMGSVTLFSGGTLVEKDMDIRFASGALIPVVAHADSNVEFSYNTPNVPNSSIDVWAGVRAATGEFTWALESVAASTTGVNLEVSAPPTLTLPVDRAIGVNLGTEFSWTPFAAGVHFALLTGPGTAPYYYILTTGNSARIPDLSAIGMPLPALTNYEWSVAAYAPFAGVDAFASPENPFATAQQFGFSLARTFQTQ